MSDRQTRKPEAIRRRRQPEDLTKLPRSAALSHLFRAAEKVAPPNYAPVSRFKPSALWDWMRSYLSYVFRRRHEFPPFTASPSNAVYDVRPFGGGGALKIAIAGDWGTGTSDAAAVATQIERFGPHVTIHLGDVYYVGDAPAVNENCLGIREPNNNYDPVTWPLGTHASFALNGNHEMYANGGGYFDVFLPRLGVRRPDRSYGGQQTSFFCLELDDWRIIAVDTGYNSIGVPILGGLPFFSRFPSIAGDCTLGGEQIRWLQTIVKPQQDSRGLVLLSHHQYYSAFDIDYPKAAQQLWAAGIRRPLLWFWGHEHRLAGYDLYGPNDLKAFGRCVGHGGMPCDHWQPKRDPAPVFWDDRVSKDGFGVNGHVNLEFEGRTLTATYVDLEGVPLLREQWTASDTGAVQLISMKRLIQDQAFRA